MKNVIIGNFKMNYTASETSEYLEKFLPLVSDLNDKTIGLCVPYTSITIAIKKCKHSKVMVGAQNIHSEEKGSFTGEISGKMLKDLQTKLVIIGHSERRVLYGENDSLINKKLFQALKNGLTAILCIGENKTDRQNGKSLEVIENQLRMALQDIYANELKSIIIAYEPVWAIGTGTSATEEQIKEVTVFIRKTIENMFNKDVAKEIKVLYGGSVNLNNAAKIFKIKQVDGALVGGCCLIPEEFAALCKL